MKKKLIILIFCSFAMTACSSDFDKAMDSGRTALRDGRYEEAAKQFDSALIEEPNNKDAMALMERTKAAIEEKKKKEKGEEFRSTFDPLYERLESFRADINLSKNPFMINNPAAQEKLETAKKIRQDLDLVSEGWAYAGGDKETLYWNLSDATDGLINAYSYILNPPARSTSSFPDTRKGRLDAARDNPQAVVNSDFTRYINNLDSYKRKTSPAQ